MNNHGNWAWELVTHADDMDIVGEAAALEYTTPVAHYISLSINPPNTVGYFVLLPGEGEYRFGVTRIPSWFHRTMMRLVFGWHWKKIEAPTQP